MESPAGRPHGGPSDSANRSIEENVKPWKFVDTAGQGLVSPERGHCNLPAESRRERWLRWFILWLHYPIMCMFYTTLAARHCALAGTYGPAPADQFNTLPLTPLLAHYPCDGSSGEKALYALCRYPIVFWNLLHMLQPEVWFTWVVLLSCARFPTAALLPSRWRGLAMFLLDYSCRLGAFVGTLLNGPRMPPGPTAVWHFYIGSPIVEVIVYLGLESPIPAVEILHAAITTGALVLITLWHRTHFPELHQQLLPHHQGVWLHVAKHAMAVFGCALHAWLSAGKARRRRGSGSSSGGMRSGSSLVGAGGSGGSSGCGNGSGSAAGNTSSRSVAGPLGCMSVTGGSSRIGSICTDGGAGSGGAGGTGAAAALLAGSGGGAGFAVPGAHGCTAEQEVASSAGVAAAAVAAAGAATAAAHEAAFFGPPAAAPAVADAGLAAGALPPTAANNELLRGAPGPDMPYRGFIRRRTIVMKIPGYQPSDITPGYEERLAAVVAAQRAGRRLNAAAVRSGCIELLLDEEEWGSGVDGGSSSRPRSEWDGGGSAGADADVWVEWEGREAGEVEMEVQQVGTWGSEQPAGMPHVVGYLHALQLQLPLPGAAARVGAGEGQLAGGNVACGGDGEAEEGWVLVAAGGGEVAQVPEGAALVALGAAGGRVAVASRTLALRPSPTPSPVPGPRPTPSLLWPLRPPATLISLQPRALHISPTTSVATPVLPSVSQPLLDTADGSGAAIAAVSGGRLSALVRQPRAALNNAGTGAGVLSVGYGSGDGSGSVSVLVRSQGVVLPVMATVREVGDQPDDRGVAGGSGGCHGAGAEGNGGSSNSSANSSTGWLEARSGAAASTAVVREGNGDGGMVTYEYDIELLAPPPGPGVALVEFRWSGVPFLVQAVLLTDSSAAAAEVAAAMAPPPYDTPAAAAVTAAANAPAPAIRCVEEAEVKAEVKGDVMQTEGWGAQGDEGEAPGPRRWVNGDRNCEELLLDLGTWAYHTARVGVLTHTHPGAAGAAGAAAGAVAGSSSSSPCACPVPRQASADTWGGSECSVLSGVAAAPCSISGSFALSGSGSASSTTRTVDSGCSSLQLPLEEVVNLGEQQGQGQGEVPRVGPPLADLVRLGQHLLGYARECGWAGVAVWVWAGLTQLQLQGCGNGAGVNGHGVTGGAEGGKGAREESAGAGSETVVCRAAGAAVDLRMGRQDSSNVGGGGGADLDAAGQAVGVGGKAEAEAGRRARNNGWRVQALHPLDVLLLALAVRHVLTHAGGGGNDGSADLGDLSGTKPYSLQTPSTPIIIAALAMAALVAAVAQWYPATPSNRLSTRRAVLTRGSLPPPPPPLPSRLPTRYLCHVVAKAAVAAGWMPAYAPAEYFWGVGLVVVESVLLPLCCPLPVTMTAVVYAANAVAHAMLLLRLAASAAGLQGTLASAAQQLGSQAQPPVEHLLHHLGGAPYGEAACVAARAALVGVGLTVLLGLLHSRRRQEAV